MKDRLIEKLVDELSLPLTSERQVVYILVQIRKLMDSDSLSESEYPELRMFCNWAMHIDLCNSTVRKKLEFINQLGWNIPEGTLTTKQLEKCSEILSLESARMDFLAFIRAHRLNQKLAHVFTPMWWAYFLRQYFLVISDFPLILKGKDINVRNIKSASITGYEMKIDPISTSGIECRFELQWVVEFENGFKAIIPIPIDFERATFKFGRAGRS